MTDPLDNDMLVLEAFDKYRPSGSRYWSELSDDERRGWIKATDYIVGEAKKNALSEYLERVMGSPPNNLRDEIAHAVNRYSTENSSSAPNFILAEYLVDCLAAFDKAVQRRAEWYERTLSIEPFNVSSAERDGIKRASERAAILGFNEPAEYPVKPR
jgi:hypothetical protein